MRRLLSLVLMAAVLAAPVAAQRAPTYEALTIDNTARSISTVTLSGMAMCIAVLETAEVRWRNDGTAPTSSVGTPFSAGTSLRFDNLVDAARAQFIRTGAASATLHVNCFPSGGTVGVARSSGGSGSDIPLLTDIETNTESTATNTSTIATNLSQDATHDQASLSTGPQQLAECDDTATDAVDEGDAGKVRIDCTSRALLTTGDIAHDAVEAGKPALLGATAESGLSGITTVADGDRTRLYAGLDGVLITRPHANLEDVTRDRATNTDGVSTAFVGELAAAGAGIKHWLTWCTFANSSATAVTVDLRDGAAGSVLWSGPVPANTNGAHVVFPTPFDFTANTAVAYDASAAATTITITCGGFKSKL